MTLDEDLCQYENICTFNNDYRKSFWISPFISICIYLPFFFPSTLSVQSTRDGQVEKYREVEQKREKQGESISRMDVQRLEEMLQAEREERRRLELEREKLRREREMLEEQREQERGICQTVKLHLLQFEFESHLFVFVSCVISFRLFWDAKRQTRAPGTGGSPLQRAGFCSAGQTGLCHQGQT